MISRHKDQGIILRVRSFSSIREQICEMIGLLYRGFCIDVARG
jgi:hypothetical protein